MSIWPVWVLKVARKCERRHSRSLIREATAGEPRHWLQTLTGDGRRSLWGIWAAWIQQVWKCRKGGVFILCISVCLFLTLVVLILFPEAQLQPFRSGSTLHSSLSRHGCIWHHHFCSTIETVDKMDSKGTASKIVSPALSTEFCSKYLKRFVSCSI